MWGGGGDDLVLINAPYGIRGSLFPAIRPIVSLAVVSPPPLGQIAGDGGTALSAEGGGSKGEVEVRGRWRWR